MRSPSRLKQNVWFSEIEERIDGIDTIKAYGKPIMKRFVVSATAGTPDELAAGIVPTYDRYIVSHDRSFCDIAKEGMAVWIDKTPITDLMGQLAMDADGVTPLTPPDYVLKKILATQKGQVFRYGIVKIGGIE